MGKTPQETLSLATAQDATQQSVSEQVQISLFSAHGSLLCAEVELVSVP